MKSIVIKYGLIGGIIVSIFMTFNMLNMDMESADMDMSEYISLRLAPYSLAFGSLEMINTMEA